MRTPLLIALGIAVSATAAHAQPAPATPPDTGVTVNMGALPTAQPKLPPMPRRKPSAAEMRALLTPPMPRHKPDPAALAAETSAAPDAAVAAAPTALTTEAAATPAPASAGTVLPRPKPQLALAEAKPHEPKKPPEIGTEASPAPPAPMTSPQGATDIAAALRGNTTAGPDPTAGFAVLTRVRFRTGHSDLGDDAKVTLDALATRLLGNEERVRLAGFSGAPGDMSSDARRLSLARALAVRSYLTSKGVAAIRLDVLAFGGSTNGDRVDVLVRAT